MSQDNPISIDAYLLPPSFAVYLQGAVFIPVLVKPNENLTSADVWVAPLVVGGNTTRIHWCLVLMCSNPDYYPRLRLEFMENAIVFTSAGGIIPTGDQLSMSTTQIALANFNISRATTEYTLKIQLVEIVQDVPRPTVKGSFEVKVKADPAIAVTPDPVEIPNWP